MGFYELISGLKNQETFRVGDYFYLNGQRIEG